MPSSVRVLRDTYQDSVKLMRVASDVADEFDVDGAAARMGTAENRRMLVETGLVEAAALDDVAPQDMLLAARAATADTVEQALDWMVETVRGRHGSDHGDPGTRGETRPPRSITGAVRRLPAANLALVSVPGEYAAREAWKALHEGLHVHLFSDNVPPEDERRLKSFGTAHDRLVMGPDCGSAIIDGVPLGFANAVETGPVGVVSAAGTGLQEVTTLVDRAGWGVSHAIGTGGRDLRDAIGGQSTKQGLAMLRRDPGTEVLLLVSKPPDPEAREEVLTAVGDCPDPVVVAFLGSDPEPIESAGGIAADSLKEAARLAVQHLPGSDGTTVGFDAGVTAFTEPGRAGDLVAERDDPGTDRREVRGLYTGGTLCQEALLALGDVTEVASNVGPGPSVADPLAPQGDALVDLGTDVLTRGRPHPMIDTTLRDEQLARAVRGETVLVVLLDVVLGYGAHENPAGAVAEVLREEGMGGSERDWPVVVTSVCGTAGDPQGWEGQIDDLVAAGAYVAESNVDAARLAAAVRATAAASGGEAP
jgi:succinyl-CoA synthetase alpha subunit